MTKGSDQGRIGPILAACLAQVGASQEWFARRVLPLSLDQLRWRSRFGTWSISECLEHLNRTLVYYLPKIEEAIDRSPRQMWDLAHGLSLTELEEDFLMQVEPPIQSTFGTPSALLPGPAIDLDGIVDQFPQLRDRYAKAALSALGLDLANISVTGSLHPPIQSLGGVIALLAVHDRRHLWQAERVRQAKGFPAALVDPSSLGEPGGNNRPEKGRLRISLQDGILPYQKENGSK